ncbi:hypothetical protein EVAR_69819_1 [Eumeta japonica]|uniref:Uncharacterized protein n=1 Tax=Eumeta variegata TaxID=151549 RepID=A0A4C1Z1Y0_EUMVA|nr:hypothetical protein EVAR_69819_1 [Eumeta japonica]
MFARDDCHSTAQTILYKVRYRETRSDVQTAPLSLCLSPSLDSFTNTSSVATIPCPFRNQSTLIAGRERNRQWRPRSRSRTRLRKGTEVGVKNMTGNGIKSSTEIEIVSRTLDREWNQKLFRSRLGSESGMKQIGTKSMIKIGIDNKIPIMITIEIAIGRYIK